MEGYQNSYQNSSSARETEFQRLAQNIGTNIQKIQQNVTSMQRMLTQIGTPQDSDQLQRQLHQIQHYTQQLAKDSSKQLRELNSFSQEEALDPRQWKLQRERLQAEFTKALDNFQRAQRSAMQKERDAIKKAKSQGLPPGEDNLIDIEGGAGAMKQNQMMIEEEQNIQYLQERESKMRQLEDDIRDVNDIFKDLAAMVHDQGEIVDSIESNVESAGIHVHEGAEQLMQAERYQIVSRKRKFYLMCVAACILLILIFSLWITH